MAWSGCSTAPCARRRIDEAFRRAAREPEVHVASCVRRRPLLHKGPVVLAHAEVDEALLERAASATRPPVGSRRRRRCHDPSRRGNVVSKNCTQYIQMPPPLPKGTKFEVPPSGNKKYTATIPIRGKMRRVSFGHSGSRTSRVGGVRTSRTRLMWWSRRVRVLVWHARV
jgi:hypothetical protein